MKFILILWFLLVSLPAFANEDLRQKIEAMQTLTYYEIAGEELHDFHNLSLFYESRNYELFWINNHTLTDAAQALLHEIMLAESHGLLAVDYHSATFITMTGQFDSISEVELDLLLTDAFLTWSRHLAVGKVNPLNVSADWVAQATDFDALNTLRAVERGSDLGLVLKELLPSQPRYFRLKDTLALYRNQLQRIDLREWQPIADRPTLKPGAIDDRVPMIRTRLIFWGDASQESSSETSELYDESLQLAVKKFQNRHGLEEDGVLGGETFQALNWDLAERIKTIVVNMERWRWLENNFGSEFIVVNIAGFDLRLFSDNQVVFQTPVIVGRNYRKSPVFSDTIKYIVFNPTWTVPHKLAVQDKLPEIIKDSNYLNRLGFTVYPLGSNTAIDANTIDWTTLSKKYFPFRLVQAPGPLNALGQVKFMFPNPFDVYLHDTPTRDLFAKPQRAFSSGCIRVSNPLALASMLLKGQGWTSSQTDAVMETLETKTVYLKKPMPIHIEYWTAWVDKSGSLNFRPDIYKRDPSLWQALNTPVSSGSQYVKK